ncbi:MAG: YciI family protein [Frankiaceae bacterium]
MKYMMFVVADPDAAAEARTEPTEDRPTIHEWLADVEGRGKRLIGDALRPVSDATTVRVSRGQVLVTDGPFIESKEWIAGFDVLECDDLDEAIAIAAAHPMAVGGKLELRPFRTDLD